MARGAGPKSLAAPATWTLRDYHSPNLIWLPERNGFQRVGLLDFQDAVLGHPAYDVVSLLQDARVDVPADLELKLLGALCAAAQGGRPRLRHERPSRAPTPCSGAQRDTKMLGIFARLDRRDGKPQYLKHLPRIEAYLRRDLASSRAGRPRAWYETNLPALAAAA